ncbi:MAG: putative zinc-binding metallopeptidase [Proteobacteria bacterium]|nr:putative zinc-binding metallopeptidase [Pseudomonadota bacterium]
MTNFYILLLLVLTSYNSYAQEISIEDINQRVLAMEKKFSIKIYIDTLPSMTGDIEYDFAQAQDYHSLYKYLALFDKEFSKYPMSFLKKSGLRGIAIGKNLTVDLGSRIRVSAGIPDTYKEIMYFNLTVSNSNSTSQKRTIHHEFHHMLDEQFNGKRSWNDPVWNSFNEDNDAYGAGRINMRGYTALLINNSTKGFVRLYSQSYLWEDKADIFAIIFTQEHQQQLTKWLKQDEILSKKVAYIKNFLKGIDRSFSPEYWDQLHD